MPAWVVLIRGINVGGRVLPMQRLVERMESAGCTKVRTYIQSGNAVCESAMRDPRRLADAISAAILATEGFAPKVMVLSKDALAAAAQRNPYPTAEPKALHLFFLAAPPADPSLAALAPVRADQEQYALDGTTFYFHAPRGFGTSKLAARFERLAKVDATARNWATVTALLALANAPAEPARPAKAATAPRAKAATRAKTAPRATRAKAAKRPR